MSNSASSLPDDIESLRRLVAAQREELDAERAARKAAESALFSRDLLIEKLKVQIARLKRMHFGRSSEKLATEIPQLELALEELETAQAELPPRAASIGHERKRQIAHCLPIFRARRSFTFRQAAIAFVRLVGRSSSSRRGRR